MSMGARAVLLIIGLYRSLSAGRRPTCRYVPSCSEYAAEAFVSHGFWRAAGLSLHRLSRCRPGAGFGYDPVPGAHRSHGSDGQTNEGQAA